MRVSFVRSDIELDIETAQHANEPLDHLIRDGQRAVDVFPPHFAACFHHFLDLLPPHRPIPATAAILPISLACTEAAASGPVLHLLRSLLTLAFAGSGAPSNTSTGVTPFCCSILTCCTQ